MKEKDIAEIKRLNSKYEKAKLKCDSALAAIEFKLTETCGRTILANEFPGDGLGVQIESSRGDCYMSMPMALDIIKLKGTIDENDRTYF